MIHLGGSSNGNKHLPYKCGLCDSAEETLEGIKRHCRTVHEIGSQFKCSLCDLSSDTKTEVEEHFANRHPRAQFCMIRQDCTRGVRLSERLVKLWQNGKEKL